MADLTYYAAKIAECLRLLESNDDPLYRNVYQAMADEFAEKHAALQRQMAAKASPEPPSALLHRVAPPAPTRAKGSLAAPKPGKSAAPRRSRRVVPAEDVAGQASPSGDPAVALPRH
jgi:hypothetical protein